MNMVTDTQTPTHTGAPRKPLQQGTALSAPFWEAAREGRLVIQRCTECGQLRHYPRLLCSRCFSDQCDWAEASGEGTVHSWTVAHHAFHPAFADELPYTLVTVDLKEGVRALGRWREGRTPSVGQAVRGGFERREDGVDLVFQALAP